MCFLPIQFWIIHVFWPATNCKYRTCTLRIRLHFCYAYFLPFFKYFKVCPGYPNVCDVKKKLCFEYCLWPHSSAGSLVFIAKIWSYWPGHVRRTQLPLSKESFNDILPQFFQQTALSWGTLCMYNVHFYRAITRKYKGFTLSNLAILVCTTRVEFSSISLALRSLK
jgi:hypothetical protein